MSETILIRKEEEGDFESIYDLVEQAFASKIQADLVSRLREESKQQLSLVALEGEKGWGIFFIHQSRLKIIWLGFQRHNCPPFLYCPNIKEKALVQSL